MTVSLSATSWQSRCVAWIGLVAMTCGFACRAQTVEYIHTDALGSPVAVTNAAGMVIERTEYAPYGEQLNRAEDDGPGYTGHVVDKTTGLNYMQQRYYDPGIGRFLSVDPVTAHSDPVGMFNRYKYAANNPYSFKDPDGRQECRSCEIAYGASASLNLTPEQRRVWEGGERAATTAGNGAEEGAALMDGVKAFAANPHITKEAVVQLAAVLVMAKLTHGRNVSAGGGAKASNLSAAELKRIQNAANRSRETIAVVGSRAGGTARANSDWDYVVDANAKTRNNLSRSLPGAGNLSEGERPNIDVFRGEVDKARPYIEISPEP